MALFVFYPYWKRYFCRHLSARARQSVSISSSMKPSYVHGAQSYKGCPSNGICRGLQYRFSFRHRDFSILLKLSVCFIHFLTHLHINIYLFIDLLRIGTTNGISLNQWEWIEYYSSYILFKGYLYRKSIISFDYGCCCGSRSQALHECVPLCCFFSSLLSIHQRNRQCAFIIAHQHEKCPLPS